MSRITILAGFAGVGKSECAIALALRTRRLHPADGITLVDLDVVNPYFRSREARNRLESKSIEVIGNSLGIDEGVDLPAIPGSVSGAVADARRTVVIDLGGGETGARAVRQFRPHVPAEDTELLLVVNASRPGCRTVEEIEQTWDALEHTVELPVTGLVNNTHLLDETTREVIERGADVCAELGELRGVSVRFTAVLSGLTPEFAELSRATGRSRRYGEPLALGGALRESWMRGE